jgi:hypothetical protein
MTLRQQGRVVPPLPTYTFDTGITVQVRKVGVMTQQAVMQAIADEWAAQGDGEPRPPTHRVNYGTDDEPEWKDEPNSADPDYQQRLQAWNQKYQLEIQDRIFTLAALEAEFDVDYEALARTRRALARVGVVLKDDPDLTEDENAKVHYFKHCAAATQEDLTGFYTALTRRSQPTQEAVERHKAAFQGDLEGA